MSTFTILGTLPGLNEYTRANRTSRYTGASMKKVCEEDVAYFARMAQLKPISGQVDVHIAWYEPNRRRDPDNVRFGIKFILDALVSLGVLEGDSQKHIRLLADRVLVDRANPRIVVTLEQVNG